MITSVQTLPDGQVKIEFEKTDGVNRFVDAIVVSEIQYNAWAKTDVDAIIEKRWQNYLAAILLVEGEE